MTYSKPILDYLVETYHPDALLVYGSFADGSANAGSDFDALVIADRPKAHDASVVDGTVLDVFVYPLEAFQGDYDPEEYLQVFDGEILLDRSGLAAQLQERVRDYLARKPMKSDEEIRQALDWCEKMLHRTLRGDAEGSYRWHWLLVDSLEIYFDSRHLRYFGPKKALRSLERQDAEAFRLYTLALQELRRERLSAWIAYLLGGAGTQEITPGRETRPADIYKEEQACAIS